MSSPIKFPVGGAWKSRWQKGKKGPLANAFNVQITLESPTWCDAFGYDQMRQRIAITRSTPLNESPRNWQDDDGVSLAVWCQREGLQVSPNGVGNVVDMVARRRPFHPVRDWLSGLSWDGTPRVDGWLMTYFGVAPSSYAAAVGRWWMISAVARAFEPGCQADHLLLLEGPQGIGKSTAMQLLVGSQWFADDLPDLANKDSSLAVLDAWVVELAELDAMRRAETTALKGFISRKTESFRPPYGKSMIRAARSCVFVGTTNETSYLKDSSGNRRFWPVRCGAIGRDALVADREQLWAEAVVLYRAGERWWPTPENGSLLAAIESEQRDRVDVDPWQSSVDDFVSGRDRTTVDEVLRHLSKVIDARTMEERGEAIVKRTQTDAIRAARCLRLAGFERTRWRDGEQRVMGFERKR
jgi:putative DNA primase/helicase